MVTSKKATIRLIRKPHKKKISEIFKQAQNNIKENVGEEKKGFQFDKTDEMNPIKDNPYRTLGLLAGASTREISRQTNRLHKIITAEQEPPTDDFSFPVLGNLTRTEEAIEEATSKLNLDSDKLNAALFWFWNGNPITDEVAFEALKDGDTEKAYQIWDKLMVETKEDGKRFWRSVTEKNSSAFHNSFVLEMLQTNGNKHTAIVANLYFLESDFSQKFISTIADSTYKTNSKELQTNFLNDVLQETEKGNANLTLSKFVSIINGVDFTAKADFLKSISRKFVNNIYIQIETAKRKRTANKTNAAKAGEELIKLSKNDLNQLKSIFGGQDFTYSNIADKIANEILQCSVDFFNHSQDVDANNDYHNTATRLAKLAEGVAVGSLVKERIKENLATLEEMKDKEIKEAIAVLLFIKTSYQKNERDIDAMVVQQERNLPYGQSINWSKVDEMKRNSLKWDKIVELVKQAIPQKKLEKIKNATNQQQVNEYKTLVNFLMGKLSWPYKSQVKYLDYWNTSFYSPNSTYKPTTSSSNSSSQGNWFEENIGCTTMLVIGFIVFLISILS